MKVLSFILAFFTFSLSMFPCDDELMVSSVGETEIIDSDHNGHPCESGVDYCSPFCVCAITIVEDFSSMNISSLETQEFQVIKFSYLAPFSRGISSSVFQPPRI